MLGNGVPFFAQPSSPKGRGWPTWHAAALLVAAGIVTASGCFTPSLSDDTDAATDSDTASSEGTGGTGDVTSGADGMTGAATMAPTTMGGSSAADSDGTTGGVDDTSDDATASGPTSDSESDVDSSSDGGLETVCPVFFDTFDSDQIDLRWNKQSPESLSQANGEAIINVTGAFNDQFARFQALPETNGFLEGTARMEIGDPPPVDGILLIMWVQPLNNEGRIAYNLAHHGDEILLEARITPEVGLASIVDSTPWIPETMQWMGLREQAGTLYFETSQDGVTYDVLFELPTPIDVSSAFIGFVGHNNLQLVDDHQVSIRSFELVCG